jgi:signal transduction histidine kinase
MLAMVIIPTAATIALGAVRVQSAQENAANFARVNQLAVLGGDIAVLAQGIEDERDLTAGYLANQQSGQATLAKSLSSQLSHQYAVTDSRLATVRTLAAQIGSGFPAVARSDLTSALSQLQAVPDVRDLVHTKFTALPAITNYSTIISSLLAFDNDIAVGNSNAQLAQTVIALGSVAQMEDQASQQRAILYAALFQQEFEPGALKALTAAQSNEASDLAAFQTTAVNLPAYFLASGGNPAGFSPTLSQVQQFNDIVQGPGIDGAQAIEQDSVIAGNAGQPPVGGVQNAQEWYSDMSIDLADIRSSERNELAAISAQANSQHQSSEFSEQLTVASVLLLLLLVLGVTTYMARSMIVPLRRLRSDALDVAGRRLPDMVRRLSENQGADESPTIEPVGINSTDEIGEVAKAFDQVHREAVRLASEEAMLRANLNAMFVNLSRRSQSLIERQLGIIDQLEQSEQEPDRLSSLFRLDHLATRMRRNSENLLVLAGHEAPHKWSQPVPLVDVLRAAVSEIEQFDRIVLNVQSGIVVVGRAASDIVHLAAELVENATMFSPESAQVLVGAQQVTTGGVLIEISDNGVGILDQELAHANWRLENPPVVDVAVSRRMGLFVVGRLAARHGIRVRLQHGHIGPRGGLTALIWLPDSLAEPESASPLGMLRRRTQVENRRGESDAHRLVATAGHRLPRSASMTGGHATNAAGMTAEPVASWEAPVAAPVAPVVVPAAPVIPVAPVAPAGDQRGQRLPIYDSVESDWFRRSGNGDDGDDQHAATSTQPSPSAATSAWASPADDGWRAAAQVIQSPSAGAATSAGLPRRVPSANLVPGSVGGQRAGAAKPAAPARSADEARRRLAGLQRGIREGRAASPGGYGATDGSPGGAP